MSSNVIYGIRLRNNLGAIVTTFTPGATHTLELYATGATAFRGFLATSLSGAVTVSNSFTGTKAGTFNSGTGYQLSSGCSGAVTHTSGANKLTSSIAWVAPSAASGITTVTFASVFVQTQNSNNYLVQVQVNADSGTPTASVSLSPPNTPSHSTSITPGGTPSNTPATTTTPSVTHSPPVTVSSFPSISVSQSSGASPPNTPSITPISTPTRTPSGTPPVTGTRTPPVTKTPTPSSTVLPSASHTTGITPTTTPSHTSSTSPSMASFPSPSPEPGWFSVAFTNQLNLRWATHLSTSNVHFQLIYHDTSLRGQPMSSVPWFGFGVSPSGKMINSDVIIVQPGAVQAPNYGLTQVVLGGYDPSTFHFVPDNMLTIQNMFTTWNSTTGVLSCSFTKMIARGNYSGALTMNMAGGDTAVIYAIGSSSILSMHSTVASSNINFASGTMSAISVSSSILIHGLLMALCWLILFPSGVGIARYGRAYTPRGIKAFWFQYHRYMQSFALLLTLIAFVVVFLYVPSTSHFNNLHKVLGLIVVIAACFQPINAFFRPHPPAEGEEPSYFRRMWSLFHRSFGFLTLVLGAVTVLLGLGQFEEPNEAPAYLWAIAIILILIVVGTFVIYELKKRGYAVNTVKSMSSGFGTSRRPPISSDNKNELQASKSAFDIVNNNSHKGGNHDDAHVVPNPIAEASTNSIDTHSPAISNVSNLNSIRAKMHSKYVVPFDPVKTAH
jgi:Eukaryotic cytochrome b561/Reeler domain